ncbi:MAG TPA: S24 family peptidase [bacterium]|nr:S24 family peptidase [bacterium]
MQLTEKQQIVLDAISRYRADYGVSPTLVELQTMLDIPHIRSISQHLEALEKKGYVLRGRGHRSIRIREQASIQMTFDIPVLGYANAGKPLHYADEQLLSTIQVSSSIVSNTPERYFFVRISGTSMNSKSVNGKTISDGSYALVRKQSDLDSPDAAYLFVVNDAATVKCYRHDAETLTLLPRSTDISHSPIILSAHDPVEVSGKIIDVFDLA